MQPYLYLHFRQRPVQIVDVQNYNKSVVVSNHSVCGHCFSSHRKLRQAAKAHTSSPHRTPCSETDTDWVKGWDLSSGLEHGMNSRCFSGVVRRLSWCNWLFATSLIFENCYVGDFERRIKEWTLSCQWQVCFWSNWIKWQRKSILIKFFMNTLCFVGNLKPHCHSVALSVRTGYKNTRLLPTKSTRNSVSCLFNSTF